MVRMAVGWPDLTYPQKLLGLLTTFLSKKLLQPPQLTDESCPLRTNGRICGIVDIVIICCMAMGLNVGHGGATTTRCEGLPCFGAAPV